MTEQYTKGYTDAMDKVLEVIAELQNSGDYSNDTLDELEMRIG